MTDDDRLTQLGQQLEHIDDIAVEQRVALFEQVNAALVAELDALED